MTTLIEKHPESCVYTQYLFWKQKTLFYSGAKSWVSFEDVQKLLGDTAHSLKTVLTYSRSDGKRSRGTCLNNQTCFEKV